MASNPVNLAESDTYGDDDDVEDISSVSDDGKLMEMLLRPAVAMDEDASKVLEDDTGDPQAHAASPTAAAFANFLQVLEKKADGEEIAWALVALLSDTVSEHVSANLQKVMSLRERWWSADDAPTSHQELCYNRVFQYKGNTWAVAGIWLKRYGHFRPIGGIEFKDWKTSQYQGKTANFKLIAAKLKVGHHQFAFHTDQINGSLEYLLLHRNSLDSEELQWSTVVLSASVDNPLSLER